MARAADALEARGDGARRAEQAGEIHGAHVDAQLEGGGRHHHGELAGLEPLLGREAALAAQAAVMGGHAVLSQALGEVQGHALDEPSRVHEDEGGAVRAGQLGHAIVDLAPLLVGAHRPQLVAQHFHGEVEVAPLAHVHEGGEGTPRAHEEARRRLDRTDGGREPDALGAGQAARGDEVLEPLEGESQVRAPLVARHRVDLVHDHRAGGGQASAAGLGGEQDVEGLRGGHENVRRPLGALAALRGGGVPRPHRGTRPARRAAPRDCGGCRSRGP